MQILPRGVVVVCAPQGAGKSWNAEALAQLFGCTSVLDEWDGVTVPPEGALVLTNRLAVVARHSVEPVSRLQVAELVLKWSWPRAVELDISISEAVARTKAELLSLLRDPEIDSCVALAGRDLADSPIGAQLGLGRR